MFLFENIGKVFYWNFILMVFCFIKYLKSVFYISELLFCCYFRFGIFQNTDKTDCTDINRFLSEKRIFKADFTPSIRFLFYIIYC